MESNFLPLLAVVVSVVVVVAYARYQDSELAYRVSLYVWNKRDRAWKKRVVKYAHETARATLANGGYTVSPKGHIPTRGYAVSVFKHGASFGLVDATVWTHEAIVENFAWYWGDLYKSEYFASDKRAYFGTWLDSSTDTLWLDFTIVVETEQEALTIGKREKQLAVYCIHEGKVIPVQ